MIPASGLAISEEPTSNSRSNTRRRFGVLSVVFAILLAVPALADPGTGADRLKPMIGFRFPGTEWATRADLAQWLEGSEPVVLLDAREPKEFAVSHLLGAERVDPDVEAKALQHIPRDVRIVVYCSVGYRSAAVARRLSEAGYPEVYNLEGGLFGWANHGGAFYRGSEPASTVHPYDRTWGRFLDEPFHAKDQED